METKDSNSGENEKYSPTNRPDHVDVSQNDKQESEKSRKEKNSESGSDSDVTEGIVGPNGIPGNLGSVDYGTGDLGGGGTDR